LLVEGILLNWVDNLLRKNKKNTLKGLSHELDLVFDDLDGHWSVHGLSSGRGQFFNF
jgi:hypothetical protein